MALPPPDAPQPQTTTLDNSTFERASLFIEDRPKLDCWFNPTSLDIHRSANWNTKPTLAGSAPKASFTGNESDSLTLKLLLHAEGRRTGARLRSDLKRLLSLPEPAVQPPGRAQMRPPFVEFHWGEFISFKAFCKRVDVTIELFDQDGTPLRAQVTVALQQSEPVPGQSAKRKRRQNPTSRATQARRLHQVNQGETLTHIAFEHYGDATKWRRIARDNNLDDPLRIIAGDVLSVRLEVEDE